MLFNESSYLIYSHWLNMMEKLSFDTFHFIIMFFTGLWQPRLKTIQLSNSIWLDHLCSGYIRNVWFTIHLLILCFFSSQVQEYPPAMDWLSSFWRALWWGMPCYNLKNWYGLRPHLALSVRAQSQRENCLILFTPLPPLFLTMRTAQLPSTLLLATVNTSHL